MYDANLVLEPGQTLIADASGQEVPVEGGGPLVVHLLLGTLSGGATTLDIRIRASMDNKANYFKIGQFQQIGPTDDNKHLAILVMVPEPDAKTYPVYLRANYDLTGSSPSYAISKIWAEPFIATAPDATDVALKEGLYARVNTL